MTYTPNRGLSKVQHNRAKRDLYPTITGRDGAARAFGQTCRVVVTDPSRAERFQREKGWVSCLFVVFLFSVLDAQDTRAN